MSDIKNVDDVSTLNKEELSVTQASSTTQVEFDADKITGEEPPDGGWEAWLVAIGGCCGMIAEFGVNYTWGVFLNYYNETVYPGKMSELSWIGSICVSFFFILGPVNEWLICKLGFKKMLLIGTILCPLALMLASISTQIWHLYLTQGVMFGIGGSFLYFPCLAAPQQWFTTKRGLAVGVSMCGSGIGGLIISNIVQASIIHLGYRWALRVTGFVCFALMLIATILIKHPKCAKQNKAESFSSLCRKQQNLLKNKQFQIMLVMGTITTLGYLTPAFYLASYANSIGLNTWVGTNLGAIMSAVNAISMFSAGWLSDYTGRVNGLFLCVFLSGIFTLTMWTTATTEAAIWVYAVLYGFFGGGFITVNGATLPEVAGYDNIAAANGLFYLTNSVGYMFGTPITSAIINSKGDEGYIYAAVYCGVLMSVGGLLCWMLRVTRSGWNPFIRA